MCCTIITHAGSVQHSMSDEDAGADSGSDMSYDSSVGSHSSLTGQFP